LQLEGHSGTGLVPGSLRDAANLVLCCRELLIRHPWFAWSGISIDVAVQRSPGRGVRGAASISTSSSFLWRPWLHLASQVLVSYKQQEKPTPPKALLFPCPIAEHLLPIERSQKV